MSSPWRGVWFIVRVLLIIFVLTSCWTADYLRNGGGWLVVGLVWAVVIAAIVVVFMGISYLADRAHRPPPALANPTFGQAYGTPYLPAQYPILQIAPQGARPCRYCDAYLFTDSPICPKCGRKN